MDNPKDAPRPDHATTRPRAIGKFWWFALGLLLVLPVMALSRLAETIDWTILAGAPLVVSFVTFLTFRHDKRRAQSGGWRVSEGTLHFMGLAGGWPGALLAQRRYRHKSSKFTFQAVFWLVVLLHQFVALDYLLHWAFLGGVLHVIRTHTG